MCVTLRVSGCLAMCLSSHWNLVTLRLDEDAIGKFGFVDSMYELFKTSIIMVCF